MMSFVDSASVDSSKLAPIDVHERINCRSKTLPVSSLESLAVSLMVLITKNRMRALRFPILSWLSIEYRTLDIEY